MRRVRLTLPVTLLLALALLPHVAPPARAEGGNGVVCGPYPWLDEAWRVRTSRVCWLGFGDAETCQSVLCTEPGTRKVCFWVWDFQLDGTYGGYWVFCIYDDVNS